MDAREFGDALPVDCIEIIPLQTVTGSDALSRKFNLLEYLLDKLIAGTKLKEKRDNLWEALRSREISVSTGIGVGVAIPHCSSEYVSESKLYIGVLAEGMEFESIDDIPVQIIVLILFPEQKFEKHLKLLAVIARILNEENVRNEILQATEPLQIQEAMRRVIDN